MARVLPAAKLPAFMLKPFTVREAYMFGVMSQGLDKHAQKCRCCACLFRNVVDSEALFFYHPEEEHCSECMLSGVDESGARKCERCASVGLRGDMDKGKP